MNSFIDFLNVGEHNVLYFCYSNLHLFQAIALSKDQPGVCFYTTAVSEKKIKSDFNGESFFIPDALAMYHLQVKYFFSHQKNDRIVVIYTGCVNQLSTFIALQTFPSKKIYLLDDGLATYNLHKEKKLPANLKNKFFNHIKYFLSYFLSLKGFYNLNKKSNFEQLALFSELINYAVSFKSHLRKNGRIYLDTYINKNPYKDKPLMIASYETSLDYKKNNYMEMDKYKNVEIYYHPRVIERSKDVFLEDYIISHKKLFVELSSVILYLMFIEYKGEVWIPESGCDLFTKKTLEQIGHIYYY